MERYNKILSDLPGTWNPYGVTIRGYRYGLCPVCLTIHEEDAPRHGGVGYGMCLYHGGEQCLESERNENLWNKFKYSTARGSYEVEFCFECGRPSHKHGHYGLTGYDEPKGERLQIQPGATFWECTGSGGGGRQELIARILGIIEFFNSLNPSGPIYYNKDFKTQMAKAAYEAASNRDKLREAARLVPVAGRPFKTFPEIRRDLFFTPAGGIAEEVREIPGWNNPDRPPQCPFANGHYTHFPPTLVPANPNEACYTCLAENLVRYRFKHNNHNGETYEHGDDQLICMTCIFNKLISGLNDPEISCFVPTGNGCGGTLHPCEFGMIRDQDMPEDAARHPVDIRNGEDLFQAFVRKARTLKMKLRGGRLTKRRLRKHKKVRKQTKRRRAK